MMVRIFVFLGVGCCLWVGCQRIPLDGDEGAGSDAPSIHHDFGQPLGMTRGEYASYLTERAALMAESEMARLAAVEMIYRNKTYRHSFRSQAVDLQGSVYTKMYRQFTGFEILDIVSSNSVLRPLSVEVRFEYDLLGTEEVSDTGDRKLDVNSAKSKYDFRVVSEGAMEFEYECDEDGTRIGPDPPGLERPNYYDSIRAFDQATKWLELMDL